MKALFFALITLFVLTGCAPKSVSYYKEHPDEAREKLGECAENLITLEIPKSKKKWKECRNATIAMSGLKD